MNSTLWYIFCPSAHPLCFPFQALQVMDYVFVIAMGMELTLKVLAEGMFFTPKALIKDVSGVLDVLIFTVSLIWICWLPKRIQPNSLAQFLMLLRCEGMKRHWGCVHFLNKNVRCQGFGGKSPWCRQIRHIPSYWTGLFDTVQW